MAGRHLKHCLIGAFSSILLVSACGNNSANEGRCEPGFWHVVQTRQPCLQAEQTVVDDCQELDDPVAAVEAFAVPPGFPEECAPIAQDGMLEVDCELEVDLDSLVATLDSALVEQYLGEIDFSDCRAVLELSGAGTYSEQSFNYGFKTSLRCTESCSFEAVQLCVAAQTALGAPVCPTLHRLRGDLQ